MRTYILRRLLLAVPTLVGASLLVFFMVRLIPGGVVDQIAGDNPLGSGERQRIERDLGLDRPAYEQYFAWIGDIVRLDFGKSLRDGSSITHRLYWCDGSYVTHAAPLSGTPKLRLVKGFTVEASLNLPTESGAFYEAGCDGDPDHQQCKWTTVEIASQTACERVVFDITHGQLPFFMDDMTAATGECPQPPCEFEAGAQLARDDTPGATVRCSWGAVKTIYR